VSGTDIFYGGTVEIGELGWIGGIGEEMERMHYRGGGGGALDNMFKTVMYAYNLLK
jgi:hypothetical protein